MRGKISEAEYWEALQVRYGFAIPDSISEEFMKWNGLKANQKVLSLVSEANRKVGKPPFFQMSSSQPTTHWKPPPLRSFDHIIASCDVGFAKPDQEIYAIALDRLNTSAKESVL